MQQWGDANPMGWGPAPILHPRMTEGCQVRSFLSPPQCDSAGDAGTLRSCRCLPGMESIPWDDVLEQHCQRQGAQDIPLKVTSRCLCTQHEGKTSQGRLFISRRILRMLVWEAAEFLTNHFIITYKVSQNINFSFTLSTRECPKQQFQVLPERKKQQLISHWAGRQQDTNMDPEDSNLGEKRSRNMSEEEEVGQFSPECNFTLSYRSPAPGVQGLLCFCNPFNAPSAT
ncbi:uncharacterized protein LOC115599279 [Calypte anna]|uniref:uncharacterized protein LOC115599279 n=1 Tax=Calypte anna TaxID=9244 RepID=UPI0011C3774A|nr:uncharacterized protein LOC115599279 [Calypte anna]